VHSICIAEIAGVVVPIEAVDETIIIAENDAMMRGLLRSLLDQPGRNLLLCKDGMEAVELAEQSPATLILLDLRMPRMDGIEACAQIRELPRCEHVPIVILTVFRDEPQRRRALRAGADLFLAKPVSRQQLLDKLNPLIQNYKRRQEPERY
jgi:CheY-like chemotaxis protein